ncbi:hypothetical protein CW304_05585 [Bacillus sp. UFRGS-B20]|nr:hypothetical protein CW304_05585 [Bacillus sp. UFRGS-B20]
MCCFIFKYKKSSYNIGQTIFIWKFKHVNCTPEGIFKEPSSAAASIICLHNHPSGDPLSIY